MNIIRGSASVRTLAGLLLSMPALGSIASAASATQFLLTGQEFPGSLARPVRAFTPPTGG